MSKPNLARAIQYATEKHTGQVRKYTGEPFIRHPLRVMAAVASDREYGGDERAAMIAVLHDVVEDCTENETDFEREVLYQEILDNFGLSVQIGVVELTNEFTSKRHPKKNRAKRKKLEFERLRGISDRGKVTKLYDRQDNLEDTIRAWEVAVTKDDREALKQRKFNETFARESWELGFALASHDNAHISGRVMTLAAKLRDMVNG